MQVAYTIAQSMDTEEREYRPLERIRDNYPKYLLTTDYLLQKRSGIRHVNLMEFMNNGAEFWKRGVTQQSYIARKLFLIVLYFSA